MRPRSSPVDEAAHRREQPARSRGARDVLREAALRTERAHLQSWVRRVGVRTSTALAEVRRTSAREDAS